MQAPGRCAPLAADTTAPHRRPLAAAHRHAAAADGGGAAAAGAHHAHHAHHHDAGGVLSPAGGGEDALIACEVARCMQRLVDSVVLGQLMCRCVRVAAGIGWRHSRHPPLDEVCGAPRPTHALPPPRSAPMRTRGLVGARWARLRLSQLWSIAWCLPPLRGRGYMASVFFRLGALSSPRHPRKPAACRRPNKRCAAAPRAARQTLGV
jgi:hypothetical protein